jgi:hypothetical protein
MTKVIKSRWEKRLEYNLIFIIISLIIFTSFISATCDWTDYGSQYTPLTNAQLSSGASCYGLFNSGNFKNTTIVQGMTTLAYGGTQPVVSNINSSFDYSFFSNGNYLQVYDGNLALKQEILTGLGLSNLNALDFDGDGLNNEIAGLFRYNNTQFYLDVYSYNFSSNLFYSIYQQNFTVSDVSSSLWGGLRSSMGNLFFVNKTNMITVNRTDTILTILPLSYGGNSYTEPVAWFDMDSDGNTEYLTFSTTSFIVFRQDGTIVLMVNNTDASKYFLKARMFNADGTTWKVVVLKGDSSGGASSTLTAYKLDGSTYWNKAIPEIIAGGDMAIGDYDGDGNDDIYLMTAKLVFTTGYTTTTQFKIFKGTNGNQLNSKVDVLSYGEANSYRKTYLTLADLNHDLQNDIIAIQDGRFWFFDVYNNVTIFQANLSNVLLSPIPADVNFDGFQEILISGSGYTVIYSTNSTNQNAVIQSVTYDTGTTIELNSTLYMYVTLTDAENNIPFQCSVDCFGDGNWSAETGTTLSCVYLQLGQFNNTIRCRDAYHSGEYDYLSQMISVTQTGATCDNDGICDISQGENINNCPSDCPLSNEDYIQSAGGGSAIPTKLVDVNNVEQGLLPEIWYGTLGFFSYTLVPLIILIFVIFFTLIILSIATIIKKIANKV